MSTFKVGQRVRIVGPSTSASIGREATVVSDLRFGPIFTQDGQIDASYYLISIRGIGERADDGRRHARMPHHLEPIVPDGHRSGDYTFRELMDRLKAGEVECV